MKWPNLVVTGTPGTGKTTLSAMLASTLEEELEAKYEHVNVGQFVQEHHCYEGFDEKWQSYEVNEERLLDELEVVQSEGGKILDWHTSELFPERWVDLVVVLRCPHSIIWERLSARGYDEAKIQENNMAEIMNVSAEEAHEAYDERIVVELENKEYGDLEENVARIVEWVRRHVGHAGEI